MKKARDFIWQLSHNNSSETHLPFHQLLIDKQIRRHIYSEFLKTETKPFFYLFFHEEISEKEYSAGMSFNDNREMSERVTGLFNEFVSLQSKGKLPQRYFAHQLRETLTIRTLLDIESSYTRFQNTELENLTFAEQASKADRFAETLLIQTSKLTSTNLKHRLLTWITEDKNDFHIHLKTKGNTVAEFTKQKEKYLSFKEYILPAVVSEIMRLSPKEQPDRERALLMLNAPHAVVIPLFLEAERKALAGQSKFKTATRCGAFCSYAKKKGYFISPQNEPNQILIKFAARRYGQNIESALDSGKQKEEQLSNHINKKMRGEPPLKSFF